MRTEDEIGSTAYKVLSPEADRLHYMLLSASTTKRRVRVETGIFKVPFVLEAPVTTFSLEVMKVRPTLHERDMASEFTCRDEQQNPVTIVISHHMVEDSSVDVILTWSAAT